MKRNFPIWKLIYPEGARFTMSETDTLWFLAVKGAAQECLSSGRNYRKRAAVTDLENVLV
jgi:hypothetical protein